MFRTGQYAIGLTQLTMQNLCDLLDEKRDPENNYQEFAEVIGNDLNGAPNEQGLPTDAWRWTRPLSQKDYNTLVGIYTSGIGASVFINTRKNIGGSASDYATFAVTMARPKGTFSFGEWQNVEIEFTLLTAP